LSPPKNRFDTPNSNIVIDTLHDKLYWVGTEQLMRADLDGTNQEEVFYQQGLADIALDPVANTLWFINNPEFSDPTSIGLLVKADLNGNNRDTITSGIIVTSEIDIDSHFVYWTDFGAINRADKMGNNKEQIVSSNGVFNFQVLPTTNELLWYDNSKNSFHQLNTKTLERQELDTSVEFPQDFTFNPKTEEIIFSFEFQRARLLGFNRTTLSKTAILTVPIGAVSSIALDATNQQLYISDINGFIEKLNLQSGQLDNFYTSLEGSAVQALKLTPDLKNLIFKEWSNLVIMDSTGQKEVDTPLNGSVLGATQSPRRVYWWDFFDKLMYSANFDGSNRQSFGLPTQSSVEDFDFDEAMGKIYLSVPNEGIIYQANLDGTAVEIFVEDLEFVTQLEVDELNNFLYWTSIDTLNNTHFQRISLVNNNAQVEDLSSFQGLVSDFTVLSETMTTSLTDATFLPTTSIQVFPNPIAAHQPLNVLLSELAPAQVRLFNQSGSLLKTIEVDNQQLSISLDGFGPGAYFMEVFQKEKRGFRKFIVQE
ncbi:MAG: T9SS type A sorting domain-containing protein, partial [Bacteroidota bacterium]